MRKKSYLSKIDALYGKAYAFIMDVLIDSDNNTICLNHPIKIRHWEIDENYNKTITPIKVTKLFTGEGGCMVTADDGKDYFLYQTETLDFFALVDRVMETIDENKKKNKTK